ncbi:MAG TPA: OsmC family peroxiredoxin [Nitrospirae bacterium]|nr:OsmC family peroxiredoxin [Nitrospirota bacterium]
MSNAEGIETLEDSLEGYKEKVAPVTKGTLTWDKDLIFVGRTQRGYEIDFDARGEWGCMPTESLLLSLTGCMGIDMVSFLRKMKCKLESFKIDLEGERNPTPPQYFKTIRMTVHLSGDGITEKKVQRAISLSHEKYCSVYHTLREDLKVFVDYRINETQ